MPKSGWTSFIRLPHFVAMNLASHHRPATVSFCSNAPIASAWPFAGANGRWESFYDDTELPHAAEAIIAVPVELILPFLPDIKRARLCPVPLPRENKPKCHEIFLSFCQICPAASAVANRLRLAWIRRNTGARRRCLAGTARGPARTGFAASRARHQHRRQRMGCSPVARWC